MSGDPGDQIPPPHFLRLLFFPVLFSFQERADTERGEGRRLESYRPNRLHPRHRIFGASPPSQRVTRFLLSDRRKRRLNTPKRISPSRGSSEKPQDLLLL